MRAVLLEFVELIGEIGERVSAGCSRHEETSPRISMDLYGWNAIKILADGSQNGGIRSGAKT